MCRFLFSFSDGKGFEWIADRFSGIRICLTTVTVPLVIRGAITFFNLNTINFNCFFIHCPLQVVAAPYQDRNCFAIARELEAAFGGWKP